MVMIHRSKSSVPVRDREGLRSHVLLEKGDCAQSRMAVTWVDVKPGACQKLHQHEPEQVYVIVTGTGRMTVGDEEGDVTAGDLVFVPPKTIHGITNTGSDLLSYVSASTPTFSITGLYDKGMLASR
jgi:mannose-6-phosphate isomerase-like protein (cupin superfamily)